MSSNKFSFVASITLYLLGTVALAFTYFLFALATLSIDDALLAQILMILFGLLGIGAYGYSFRAMRPYFHPTTYTKAFWIGNAYLWGLVMVLSLGCVSAIS
ncbi:MAG: hypothetical protein KU37_08595 [Sulfuricurvum sp. PC08-66]|nr:MAG: hypothetical protein KU37_08595 [Sulfuricurvum sp. PC08-66]